MEKVFEKFEEACIGVAKGSILALIFWLLSKIGNGPFSAICGFVSTFLNSPMSKTDFFIAVFGLTGIMCILGIIFGILRFMDR